MRHLELSLAPDPEDLRCVEVTAEGEIVWEFFYPELNDEGRRATIYRCSRYPAELVDGLLKSRGANLDRRLIGSMPVAERRGGVGR